MSDGGSKLRAYWGIRTAIRKYGAEGKLPAPEARTLALAETPTRLKAMESRLQERLINWGYAITDAAMRTWVDPELHEPAGYPYPDARV